MSLIRWLWAGNNVKPTCFIASLISHKQRKLRDRRSSSLCNCTPLASENPYSYLAPDEPVRQTNHHWLVTAILQKVLNHAEPLSLSRCPDWSTVCMTNTRICTASWEHCTFTPNNDDTRVFEYNGWWISQLISQCILWIACPLHGVNELKDGPHYSLSSWCPCLEFM